jgi:hypothetical protein
MSGPTPFEALASDLVDAERAIQGRSGVRQLIDLSGRIVGTQLFDRGRICWATSQRHSGRLTEILARETHLRPADLEAIVQECRRKNLRLGEELVSRGLIAPPTLRLALLQHVAWATLGAVRCRVEDPARWGALQETPAGAYDPTFTFTTAEIFLQALGTLTEIEPALALPPDPFEDPAREVEPALCLLRLGVEPSRTVPTRVRDAAQLGLASLAENTQRLLANLILLGGGRDVPDRVFLRLPSASWFCVSRPPYVACYEIRNSQQVAILQQRFG